MSEKDYRRDADAERQLPIEKAVPDAASEDPYIYRWSYSEQTAFEQACEKKKKKNGALVYALVMTGAFLACFAILIGVLVWYRTDGNPTLGGAQSQTGGLTTGQISQQMYPATVLIYGTNRISYGYGTGFFISADGYIATNAHVVADYTDITVTLYSGQELEAEVVGLSEETDLAVLKVAGTNYPVVGIGDSDRVAVGDVAIAVGNPMGADGAWSTTQGIISALNRVVVIDEGEAIHEVPMMQTDAPVNTGNSGGPLCNNRGEVIAIISRKLTDAEGMGLAIPINGAMKVLQAIMETGSAEGFEHHVGKSRPTIGIKGTSIRAEDTYTYQGQTYTVGRDGVWVSEIVRGGAADGILQVGDVIVAFGGVTVTNMDELTNALYAKSVGDAVSITVWRDSQEVTVTVTLGKAS